MKVRRISQHSSGSTGRMTDMDWTGIHVLVHSCISCLDRARVVGGLPDVVAIQEGKVNN